MRTMRFAKLKIKPPPTQIPPVLFLAVAGIVGMVVGFEVQKHLIVEMTTILATTVIFSVLGVCFWSKTRSFAMLLIATTGLFCAKTFLEPLHTPPTRYLEASSIICRTVSLAVVPSISHRGTKRPSITSTGTLRLHTESLD